MIEFYRPVDCPACADIETVLKELVVAHKVVVIEEGQAAAELKPDVSLPAIKDNGQVVSGPTAIAAYLIELEKFVAGWQRFQSDSCYIDDDGATC
ncbi:MAG TPA: glutathione S-transferase N-terminal domain-containing protein [Anaerolineae bacterium]|nr:glutathione S-transferase N-terminal domain-containing protein [Anaerolineae bacterium]